MEILQFPTLLYSALEELSAEFEAPAALPREQPPLFVGYGAWGWGTLEWGKDFCLLPRFIARQLGCRAIPIVTEPTELSGVTYMSLFLDCHECL